MRQSPVTTLNQYSPPVRQAPSVPIEGMLRVWLEEDLESLRAQRVDLDARIRRVEGRLEALRNADDGIGSSTSAAALNTSTAPLSLPDHIASHLAVTVAPAPTEISVTVAPATSNTVAVANQVAAEDAIIAVPDFETRYEDAIALPYKFGVVRVEDFRQALDISDNAADSALRADERWNAYPGGWFIRGNVAQSWIARRVIEVLNAVRTLSIEPLFQSIKRVASAKFLEHGCRMPTRSLLITMVQELRAEGVRFDIVKEIVSVDALIHDRELSGTATAILKAFSNHHRALSGSELVASMQESGLSEASAQVALTTSPLVTRFERGIYGLVGRNADARDIASARLRREATKAVDSVSE